MAFEIPDEWTHREFQEYLQLKGITFRSISTSYGVEMGGVPYFLSFIGSGADDEKAAIEFFENKRDGVVYCSLQKTKQDARDKASAGNRNLVLGRFVITGTAPDRERIGAALKAR